MNGSGDRIVHHERWGPPSPLDLSALHPEEEQALPAAVPSRRLEFAAGRVCARAALSSLGVGSAPIGRGPRREPLWPAGVVGSITHCAGYTAAAVALRSQIAAIGIDAEPNEPLPEGVEPVVVLDEERESIRRRPDVVAWDRLLFSAKESVYKAWFPLTARWLDFHDVTIRFDDACAFRAHLPSPIEVDGALVDGFDGAFDLSHPGFIRTRVVVAAGPALHRG